MASIIVLGSGMVGSAMAIDLSKSHSVTATDMDPAILASLATRCPEVNTLKLDVTDTQALTQAISSFDLVICAVPGYLGYDTLRHIIMAGKHVVDISFFPEDALMLNDLAKEHRVTAIVDCGVAPGMGNLLLGYHNRHMQVERFECLVGGLPLVRTWPFEYKAPFSPVDVIEEYTRPARYVENGHVVVKPALSDVEHVSFPQVGTLESFNSDGLRTLITTMSHIPDMKEKTLRYPGHAEKMRVLRDAGFFSTDPIEVGGSRLAPLAFTSRILFDNWKLGTEEEEFTVMRVTISGKDKKGKEETWAYTLLDRYDALSKTSSMARTTGYTATAAAQWLLETQPGLSGVFPPEQIGGMDGCADYFLNYLSARNVRYEKQKV
ncbi:MAG: saccharopine dehydrogenase NADP-binding domain-containing protein [Flavobacteriales bacterium]|nr:saccharopine dehydrogenase NADP-binding domain-containing protein [Flavobacteriales bacterium]MCB9448496.1 saccharopine dehydrogenase NADP-binding domain-containing protein [Flavobacteriales bacterium]